MDENRKKALAQALGQVAQLPLGAARVELPDVEQHVEGLAGLGALGAGADAPQMGVDDSRAMRAWPA